jgi:hypothetical protein
LKRKEHSKVRFGHSAFKKFWATLQFTFHIQNIIANKKSNWLQKWIKLYCITQIIIHYLKSDSGGGMFYHSCADRWDRHTVLPCSGEGPSLASPMQPHRSPPTTLQRLPEPSSSSAYRASCCGTSPTPLSSHSTHIDFAAGDINKGTEE